MLFVWWDGLPERTADQKNSVWGKKYFYYRCRQLSAQEQMQKMGEEIQNAFQMKLSRYSYDEFFNRVKSGDASKLVIVIDEAQYAIKKRSGICQKYFKTEDETALSGK